MTQKKEENVGLLVSLGYFGLDVGHIYDIPFSQEGSFQHSMMR